MAKTCADYPGQCGSLANGCGGTITCGCPRSKICSSGKCVNPCVPSKTCADYPNDCRNGLSNGCTNSLNCRNYCPVGGAWCCTDGTVRVEVLRVQTPSGVERISGVEVP
ncbi:MAG: hypothetical protein GX606_03900 [Elusimicrobia bacterium]|nr:hypothetical protein [Elusimicrobiota bacterium]